MAPVAPPSAAAATSLSAAARRNERFAMALCCAQGLVTLVGAGVLSYATDAYYTATGATLVLGPYFAVLIWAVTLPPGCSPRPLWCSVGLVAPAFTISMLTSPHELANGGAARFLILTMLFGLSFSLSFYLALTAARDALRKEYAGAALAATSSRIGAEIAAGLPVVLYFAFSSVGAFIDTNATFRQYMQHTPWCAYTPDSLFEGRIPFSGCDPRADQSAGIAALPAFLNTTAHLSRDEASIAFADTTGDETLLALLDPGHALGATNTTRWLTVHDYARIEATLDFERRGATPGVQAWLQGLVFVVALFSGQIFTRVSRISFADVAAFKVTGWELAASVLTGGVLFVALLISGLSAQSLRTVVPGGIDTMVYALIVLGVPLLFVALWRVGRAAARDAHPHLAARARRGSAVGTAGSGKLLLTSRSGAAYAAEASSAEPSDGVAALREELAEAKRTHEVEAAAWRTSAAAKTETERRAHEEALAALRRDHAALRSETAALLERMAKLEAASAAVGTASEAAVMR